MMGARFVHFSGLSGACYARRTHSVTALTWAFAGVPASRARVAVPTRGVAVRPRAPLASTGTAPVGRAQRGG